MSRPSGSVWLGPARLPVREPSILRKKMHSANARKQPFSGYAACNGSQRASANRGEGGVVISCRHGHVYDVMR